MALKAYTHPTPNIGYIDTKGVRHVFAPCAGHGHFETSDEQLQKELDEAVASNGTAFAYAVAADISPAAAMAKELAAKALAEKAAAK